MNILGLSNFLLTNKPYTRVRSIRSLITGTPFTSRSPFYTSSTMPQNKFKKLLVLDFEATCSDKEAELSRSRMEIIEFPVLVYDIEEKKVTATFHEYVKPSLHPTLTNFCTTLTGIEQVTFSFRKYGKVLQSFLVAQKVFETPYDFCFLTCGNWDLQTMLPQQLNHSFIHLNSDEKKIWNRWINVKKAYQKTTGNRPAGMAGSNLEGRHHSGIDDCKNIARIVQGLQNKGWDASSERYSTRPRA
ncbi:exonuclease [Flagelloscypha sp. PMI_526]|nr:exonuclease [Flagelloscypha sp. PMI_526]